MLASAASLRFAAMYGALFLAVGIYLPFWPLWLADRDLTAEQIGLILALGLWVKVLGSPVVAQIADRSGRAKGTMVAVACLTLLSFCGFFAAQGFWAILLVNLLAATFFPTLIPLTESQTMAAVLRARLDYGRIRLWGSLTFILATVGAGRLLTGRDPDLVLILMLGALGLIVLAALAFPVAGGGAAPAPPPRGLRILLTEPRFLLFLGAASLLSSSHAVYYAFSALHWRAAGLSEATIGWLWAEGVIAEVVLFAFSGGAVALVGPVGLLVVAGLAGVVRWGVLGATTALPALVAVQALHAATFGAGHLGAMHFLARTVPPGLSATAQGVFAAVATGLAMGLVMLLAGRLYDSLGGGAFHVMAGLSVGGTLIALALARRGLD